MPHKIHVNEIPTPFHFHEGEDTHILDFLERNGVAMNSHCREGLCGTCRVSLTHGSVHYPNGPPLGYIRDGEILPCCCQPATDIKIETY
jgi:ferredoxin